MVDVGEEETLVDGDVCGVLVGGGVGGALVGVPLPANMGIAALLLVEVDDLLADDGDVWRGASAWVDAMEIEDTYCRR